MIAKKHKTQVRNKTELSFKITWCVINVYNVFIHSVFVLPSFFLTVHPCYAAALMMTWGGLMNWSILQSSAWEGSSTATWDRLIRWVFSQPPLSSCFHTSYLHKSPPTVPHCITDQRCIPELLFIKASQSWSTGHIWFLFHIITYDNGSWLLSSQGFNNRQSVNCQRLLLRRGKFHAMSAGKLMHAHE